MKALIPAPAKAEVMTTAPGLEELVSRFLESQDLASSSKDTYSRQLKRFTSWLQDTGRASKMSQLSREDILAYKQSLQDSGLSSLSVSGYLVTVRKLFTWLESEKVYPNIARDIKGMKKARGFRKDCLTPSQIRESLASIDRRTPEGLRDYALLNLLVRTGLRVIEIARAEVGDIRQESSEAVLWIQGKGRDSKDDFVLLLEDTLKPIRAYLSGRGQLPDEAPLFASISDRNQGEALSTRSISRIVKETFRGVGLDSKRLTAHSLRHTAITLSIKGGASLQQAQAMARHSDPKTTMIYFHNLNRLQAGAEKFIQF